MRISMLLFQSMDTKQPNSLEAIRRLTCDIDLGKMSPKEKYGTEFFQEAHVLKKADGSEHPFHDIGVCITPRDDEASTLAYAWEIMRELARWTCDHFKGRPASESYRIVVAWSRSVRPGQGHIVKVWLDLAGVREVAAMATPKECAARFGGGWTPFANWKKDVFKQTA